ncbi:hypothetical protein P154DRAFT_80259 [Amniculicola lignicola CBS 123094]|uniref:Uncharacterized protein n=1 Tax=Amniculicola lignicola CBS 123094 TaxID=1392246 RepID=A0A6A5WRX0_9PLEO|nr:hypothetical protein P154DRAFT_80259 [Amniculicola lignicola CBS 123094]
MSSAKGRKTQFRLTSGTKCTIISSFLASPLKKSRSAQSRSIMAFSPILRAGSCFFTTIAAYGVVASRAALTTSKIYIYRAEGIMFLPMVVMPYTLRRVSGSILAAVACVDDESQAPSSHKTRQHFTV